MRMVNVHEAKTHLSRLIQEVLDGGEVVIARDNVPLVKLVVLEGLEKPRVLGSAKGLVELTADFDAPLSDLDDYR
jgi:antitoxin (DNA-binding transcriptional repressor) of toxin-antitoxin stability system